MAGHKMSKETIDLEERLDARGQAINEKDLQWGTDDEIGRGGQGIVRKGLWLGSLTVAVKILNNLPEFLDEEEIVSFYKEIAVLGELRHSNIVTMFGYCMKSNYLCLVTEYVPGGDLRFRMDEKRLTPLQCQQVALGICSGMIFLHSRGISHRDLKPANILIETLEPVAKVKLCDFGLAKPIANGRTLLSSNNVFGTPAYAAPELHQSNSNHLVDVYSFGVILCEMSKGTKPWPGLFSSEIFTRTQQGQRPPIDPTDNFHDIIVKCWSLNPDERDPFTVIYEQVKNAQLVDNDPRREERIMARMAPYETFIPWPVFEKILSEELAVVPYSIALTRFIFQVENQVEKSIWTNFVQWFTPLSSSSQNYHTPKLTAGGEMIQRKRYHFTWEDIEKIVAPTWFYGFMTKDQVAKTLLSKGIGSFLIRFSTTSKMYTLSVCHEHGIGHWRISLEEHPTEGPIYKLEPQTFTSLLALVEFYKENPLPTTVTNHLIKLVIPCERVDVQCDGIQ
eukprot:TRINITY_DN2341_c0_g1_i1.p1 TRINITY_DN2341_c0_g1~~TRINITY_DN2341_c0_g1_i1.p1  ORF type:complete len:506 (+),score=110.78 TRINITY_DN2341_c0_g1_i1:248-1765(+)